MIINNRMKRIIMILDCFADARNDVPITQCVITRSGATKQSRNNNKNTAGEKNVSPDNDKRMKTINDNTTNTACAPMRLGLWLGNRLFTGRCPALMLSGLRPDLRRSALRKDALRGWFVIANPKDEAIRKNTIVK
jgi:hypothetical protein